MTMKVPFHKAFAPEPWWENEDRALSLDKLNTLKKQCLSSFKEHYNPYEVHLTPSCSSALEALSMAMDLGPEAEVIVPSFTYVTSASAFALRGARLIFADILPETMNVDPLAIQKLITPRTKAVVVMHYGGVACKMNEIISICKQHELFLIEDAAHALGATYRDQPLGSLGDAGTLSFHHTKNIQCGEGGLLISRRKDWPNPLDQILEKGTNRVEFNAGQVPSYDWQILGGSFEMSAVSAAYLGSALKKLEDITFTRKKLWYRYYDALSTLEISGIDLPNRDVQAEANGHIFFIKCRHKEERSRLIEYLRENGISAYFHYGPLHLSPGGRRYGSAPQGCSIAEKESQRLLRLPLYESLTEVEQDYVIEQIRRFYVAL